MFCRLINKTGNSSAIPIFLILVVSFVGTVTYFYKTVDVQIVELQKSKYRSAVDMAVKTAVATIELSTVSDIDDISNLDKIALGYTIKKKVIVDKNKLISIFYDVLWRNISLNNSPEAQMAFKRYIPVKAVVQYDTISLSTFDDKWYNYKIFKTIDDDNDPSTPGKLVFLTLSDEYYTLNNTSDLNKYDPTIDLFTISDEIEKAEKAGDTQKLEKLEKLKWLFSSENKTIYSVNDPNNPFHITETQKNKWIAEYVREMLNSFINAHKLSKFDYKIMIGHFDDHRFLSAMKDVTFFCFVEGIPIKSFLSKEPDRSFYTFSFGGASLRRADEAY